MSDGKRRVWTKDFPDSVTCHTGWMHYRACRRYIKQRWGHFPPFAIISRARTEHEFRKYNGG